MWAARSRFVYYRSKNSPGNLQPQLWRMDICCISMKSYDQQVAAHLITLRRSLLLLFIPIICMYGIIPIVAIVSPRNEGLQNTIMASRILLPAKCTSLVYGISANVDRERRAGGYAGVQQGETHLRTGTYALSRFFMLALLPGAFIVSTVYNPMFHEYFYICVQILWTGGMLYILSVLLHSVAMSSMLVLSYLLFCAFFSKDSSMQGFCLFETGGFAWLGIFDL